MERLRILSIVRVLVKSMFKQLACRDLMLHCYSPLPSPKTLPALMALSSTSQHPPPSSGLFHTSMCTTLSHLASVCLNEVILASEFLLCVNHEL